MNCYETTRLKLNMIKIKEMDEDELIIANKELAFQNEEKEKRAISNIKQTKTTTGSIISRIMGLSLLFNLLTILLGVLVLLGWWLNVEFLKHPFPSNRSMNPATALGFIFIAISLLFYNSGWHKTAHILSLLVLCLAAFKLISLALNIPAYFDTYFFSEKLNQESIGDVINSMAPNTAIEFLLSALALLFLPRQNKGKKAYSQYFSITVFVFSMISVIGYLYQIKNLYTLTVYMPMAIYAAIGFFTLSLALLFSSPAKGLMKIVSGPYIGSHIVRQILPMAIMLPILLSTIFYISGLFRNSTGEMLNVVVLTLILILTILYISHRLNKESILTIEANASLNKLAVNLERIVEERTADLNLVNIELAFQNEEKEKRAAELIIANKELLAFTYISSHDLQEPLRKILTFASIILENENKNLSENGKYNFQRMQLATRRMQQLIDDLLAFSRIKTTDHKFEKTDLSIIIEEVKTELSDTILEKHAIIETPELCAAHIITFQFRQLLYNLISNALKFSQPDIPSHIIINSRIVNGSKLNNWKLSPEKSYCHITIKDNGIGFEPHFSERIFEVFQKLHGKDVYAGTGIGLAIVKKIVENHNGIIIATSELNKGATFDIYIPAA